METLGKPKHAPNLKTVKRILYFEKKYILNTWLSLPCRKQNYSARGDKVLLLYPSDKTKSNILEIYNQAANMLHNKCMYVCFCLSNIVKAI